MNKTTETFPPGGLHTAAVGPSESEVLTIDPVNPSDRLNVTIIAPPENSSAVRVNVYAHETPAASPVLLFDGEDRNGGDVLVKPGEKRTLRFRFAAPYRHCQLRRSRCAVRRAFYLKFVVKAALAASSGSGTVAVEACSMCEPQPRRQ